ncbi:MAG TPA: hypothetical protein VK668_01870 [Mucilaginibacter sp.]|nr:hypothetical protein [Mucilaginibacter sp.]
MNILVSMVKPFEKAFNKLGICSTVGFIAGAITGFVLLCYSVNNPVIPVWTSQELLKIAAMIWLLVFLIILFMLVVFCRFTFASVFFQTLVNTLVCSFITTYLVVKVNGWVVAFFIGAIVGLLIGKLFCLICQNLKRK